MRSPDRGTAVWPLQTALLVAAALYALFFHLTLPSKLPEEDAYPRLVQHLGEHARPGDVVLLFPWWTERARLFVPEHLPVVGYVGSDADPLVRHPRIWVIAQPDLPRADVAGFEDAFLPQRTRVDEPLRFGGLELSLYENGRHREVLWSASDAVEQGAARVFIERADGRRTECRRSGDAWRCPGGGHMYVRTEWHEVFYEPRRCVYAHPPGGDARLVIDFEGVPSGGEELLLEAGILWEHAVKRAGITSTFVRLEPGAPSSDASAEVELAPGREGFVNARLAPMTDPAPGGLRLSLRAQNADARQVCLEVTAFDGDAR